MPTHFENRQQLNPAELQAWLEEYDLTSFNGLAAISIFSDEAESSRLFRDTETDKDGITFNLVTILEAIVKNADFLHEWRALGARNIPLSAPVQFGFDFKHAKPRYEATWQNELVAGKLAPNNISRRLVIKDVIEQRHVLTLDLRPSRLGISYDSAVYQRYDEAGNVLAGTVESTDLVTRQEAAILQAYLGELLREAHEINARMKLVLPKETAHAN